MVRNQTGNLITKVQMVSNLEHTIEDTHCSCMLQIPSPYHDLNLIMPFRSVEMVTCYRHDSILTNLCLRVPYGRPTVYDRIHPIAYLRSLSLSRVLEIRRILSLNGSRRCQTKSRASRPRDGCLTGPVIRLCDDSKATTSMSRI